MKNIIISQFVFQLIKTVNGKKVHRSSCFRSVKSWVNGSMPPYTYKQILIVVNRKLWEHTLVELI